MKIFLSVVVVLVLLGCEAKSKFVNFENLVIPREYILHASEDGPKGIYDDTVNDIALIIPEVEIQKAIPQYELSHRGSEEDSFVLYAVELNLKDVSESVLEDFGGENPRYEKDPYTTFMRLYRPSIGWALVDKKEDKEKLVALCSRSGMHDDIDSCDFDQNIAGYGITYHLENNNIALISEYERFLAKKIEEWRKK